VEKNFQANGCRTQAEVAMFISDKVDVRPKSIKRDNEGHNSSRKEQFINRKYQPLTNMHQTQSHPSTSKKL
jgi:hypothetical protein